MSGGGRAGENILRGMQKGKLSTKAPVRGESSEESEGAADCYEPNLTPWA